MLPFICLPLAVLWDSSGQRLRYVLKGLLAVSVFISFVCVSVDMVSPETYRNPLFDYLLPNLLQGQERTLFHIIGLGGLWTLLPLALVLGLGYFVIAKLLSGHERRASNHTSLGAVDPTH